MSVYVLSDTDFGIPREILRELASAQDDGGLESFWKLAASIAEGGCPHMGLEEQ
jgi:hypothetical protein